MKAVGLIGSTVGSKTKIAIQSTMSELADKHPGIDQTIINLADFSMAWSDGRNFLDYQGDTQFVTKTIMEADILFIGTPVFQASIPGSLKNIFDLLPQKAFQNKTVSIVVTAGSSKHYLVAEQQLKPILNYMKAHVLPSYVFIEEKDFMNKKMINDDVFFRLRDLVMDTVLFAEAHEKLREIKEAEYDF
ncbi:NADPH-dependent FMN reductase [Alkalihalobacillus pseudalcaliphilus]|uniref:NADPH-dependent FMN reductase n=1 Tax=Alkalihalobacillus pseudalcaliphilus TaxID=79884 RepID=UPI00064DAF30|nr:NADPH-dependent FMN reductase [Alkalihalobacillus pseudalcaliphilus]KMK75765.1 FMN reductase [Alkalihalobacillus pseudalcaliphilus]